MEHPGQPLTQVSIRCVLRATAFSVAVVCLPGCAASPRLDDHGIPACPAGAADDLLSANALQCWLTAPHGRWRTLSHQEAFGALVVDVEAFDVADADEITRRFVDTRAASLSEISVYVQREFATAPTLTRRIRWTSAAGFETLDFTAP